MENKIILRKASMGLFSMIFACTAKDNLTSQANKEQRHKEIQSKENLFATAWHKDIFSNRFY